MKVNYNISWPAGSMERDEAELLRDKLLPDTAANKRKRKRANENEELDVQFASLMKASMQKSDIPSPVNAFASSRCR